MCYSCREFTNEDPYKTFEYYNININEYQNLSNEVFSEYTSNSNLSDE